MGYTVDIDTGGTFTDGFFVSGDRVEPVKVPTTPHDLTVCFLDCIAAGADRFGVTVEDLLYDTDIIRFSNTIGTNTIIQRDGSRIGLLVTENREELAPSLDGDGKAPLVMKEMVLGLPEAVSPAGEIIKTPEPTEIMAAAQTLIDRGARCLVVALANSEFNPDNERYVRKVIKAEYPRDFLGSVPVFLASDISSRSGEAERINAAVLNAYIHGKLVRLLYKAGEKLRKRLYGGNLFIVHNNNAVARVAKTRAINTYNSGPAAGLLGARLTGRLYGAGTLISADMGGTSFDLGYVQDDQPSYTLRPDIEGFAANVPMMAIRPVGAGGGSIAAVMDGELRVGPNSAGALPGPVCFDLGGTEPTVTDADLILGILDPGFFLGGAMALNPEKAWEAVSEKVARPLGISVPEAALAIKMEIDRAMGEELGKFREQLNSEADPLLLVYGGAGPAHCCQVAQFAGMKKIVMTPFSAVFSAFSSSSMNVGHIYYQRVDLALDEGTDFSPLSDAVATMATEASRDIRGEGFSRDQMARTVELFVEAKETGREVKLAVPWNFYKDTTGVKDIIRAARDMLGTGASAHGGELLLTLASLVARAEVAHYEMKKIPKTAGDAADARKGSRPVFLYPGRDATETPVYDRALLTHGHELVGPALVESNQTTVLVPAGWRFTVDPYNNAFLEEVSPS